MDSAAFISTQSLASRHYGVALTTRVLPLDDPLVRVAVHETGRGEPVLLLHGGNSVAASWLPLVPALAARHRLILPDRPGCGLSGPFDYRGVDLRAHGVALVRGLLDGLGLDRAPVLANSMGGFFALAFAIEHPERVSRLVLLGEPAGSQPRATLFHRLVGTRGVNSLLYRTALRPPRDAAALRRGWGRAHLVADPGSVPDALAECLAAAARLPWAVHAWTSMVERAFEPAGAGMVARGFRLTHALVPEFERIRCPVLFLWGSRDPFGAPETGRHLAAQLPDGRVQEVEDAGHLPWIDRPETVSTAVLDFLGARV